MSFVAYVCCLECGAQGLKTRLNKNGERVSAVHNGLGGLRCVAARTTRWKPMPVETGI